MQNSLSSQKYRVALFIGRFQPFHNGHLYSYNKCLEIAERVIVGVGSSNESSTESNPWSYEERVAMIRSVVGEVVEIVPIPDNPSDSEWVRGVEEIIEERGYARSEVVVVSNNEWVTELMEQEGYPTYKTGLYKREELEGVKIREMIRGGDEGWKLRVLASVARIINNQSPIIK